MRWFLIATCVTACLLTLSVRDSQATCDSTSEYFAELCATDLISNMLIDGIGQSGDTCDVNCTMFDTTVQCLNDDGNITSVCRQSVPALLDSLLASYGFIAACNYDNFTFSCPNAVTLDTGSTSVATTSVATSTVLTTTTAQDTTTQDITTTTTVQSSSSSTPDASSSTSSSGSTSSAAPNTGSTSSAARNTGSTSSAAPNTGSTSSAAPNTGSTSSAAPNTGSTSSAAPNIGSTSSMAPNPGSTSAPIGSDPADSTTSANLVMSTTVGAPGASTNGPVTTVTTGVAETITGGVWGPPADNGASTGHGSTTTLMLLVAVTLKCLN